MSDHKCCPPKFTKGRMLQSSNQEDIQQGLSLLDALNLPPEEQLKSTKY